MAGDDVVYYMETVGTEDSGSRPVTGWTVPCSNLITGLTGLCQSSKWSQSFNFSAWAEYAVDLRGALPTPSVGLGQETCAARSTDSTVYNDAGVPYRSFPRNQSAAFLGCSFNVTGAGTAAVNGLYRRHDDFDYVARYRLAGTDIYLFRWGSTNNRITFPDATGLPASPAAVPPLRSVLVFARAHMRACGSGCIRRICRGRWMLEGAGGLPSACRLL
jgi:hypothetical protein